MGEAPQTVNLAPPSATPLVGTSESLGSFTGPSGNQVTFKVDSASTAGSCTVSGSTVTFKKGGTCIIEVNLAGDDDYTAARQVTFTFDVVTKAQTL